MGKKEEDLVNINWWKNTRGFHIQTLTYIHKYIHSYIHAKK